MIPFHLADGRRIDLEHPRVEDVDVPTICNALGNLCRFTGQVRRFYSVAQHSVLVASLVEPRLRRAASAHDWSEAFLGDLSRFLKHSTYLLGYRQIEGLWIFTIETALALHLTDDDRKQIKAADDLVAVIEREVRLRQEDWRGWDSLTDAAKDGFVKYHTEWLNMMVIVDPVVRAAERDYSPAEASDWLRRTYQGSFKGGV